MVGLLLRMLVTVASGRVQSTVHSGVSCLEGYASPGWRREQRTDLKIEGFCDVDTI